MQIAWIKSVKSTQNKNKPMAHDTTLYELIYEDETS